MRLTLRTLLAWLDDALPPKDITKIGRQIQRSRYARDLSLRIPKVLRQRRLSVPGMGANTPVDANVVAAYLDNSLPQEQVNAFESFCLNSDIHLAEVAACHQILTILDQPMKLSADQYKAMYRIVKGPEARIPASRLDKNFDKSNSSREFDSFSEKPDEQVNQIMGRTKRLRWMFIGISSTLMLCLIFLANWLNLVKTNRSSPSLDLQSGNQVAVEVDQSLGSDVTQQPQNSAELSAQDQATIAQSVLPNKVETETSVNPPAKPAAVSPEMNVMSQDLPKPNEIGKTVRPMVQKTFSPKLIVQKLKENISKQIIFHHKKSDLAKDSSAWSLVKETSDPEPGIYRFLSAQPVIIPLTDGQFKFAHGTQLEWNEENPDLFKIAYGCFQVQTEKPASLRYFLSSNKILEFNTSPSTTFSVQRAPAPESSPVDLQGFSNQILIVVHSGSLEQTFNGSVEHLETGEAYIFTLSENDWTGKVVENKDLITWPSDPTSLQVVTEQMLRFIRSNRPMASCLVEAWSSSDLLSVKQLSLVIAIAIHRQDLVLSAMMEPSQPELRRSAVEAIRSASASGMTSLSEIIELMAKESVTGTMGPELVSLLLTRPDSRTDARLDRSVLVGLLNHNAVIVRELAIEHLMHISQKDAMEYDADDPSEKSINAWIMWLNSVREKNR